MEKLFLNKEKFNKEVETVVRDQKMPYMDAIIHVCEMLDIDVDIVNKYVNKNIKVKLEVEAQDLNYLPSYNKLPGL